MTNEPIELETVPYDNTMYPRYMVRLGAALLDLLFIAPVGILVLYLNSLSKEMYYFTIVPSLAFSIWYHIYLLKKYSATPGKLLSGIRVAKTNGQDPEWREALLRYAIALSFAIFGTIISLIALSNVDAAYYESLSWRQKSAHLATLSPGLFTINLWLSNLFLWSNVIAVLRTGKEEHCMISWAVRWWLAIFI